MKNMNDLFKSYLFAKHYVVSEGVGTENPFEVVYSLAKLFNIKVVKGQENASFDVLAFCAQQLGQNVPNAFYVNFPKSVLELTSDQLLFDQLVHYAVTYGFGNFDNPAHSLFEKDFARSAFNEQAPIKEFEIVTIEQAEKLLHTAVCDLLEGSRPLSVDNYNVVKSYIEEYGFVVTRCASRNTAIKLIVDTKNIQLSKVLKVSDFVKVVEYLDFANYDYADIKQLNLVNQDRKFVTKLLDYMLQNCPLDLAECYERKVIWCGVLHHIHYKPKTQQAKEFVDQMRAKGNKSVYSQFEKFMAKGDVKNAVLCLKNGKGNGALLRNLNYVLSRSNVFQQNFVLKQLESENIIVLLQLLYTYASYPQKKLTRTFKFVRFNSMHTHTQTEDEFNRSKSHLSPKVAQKVAKRIKQLLLCALKGKLGKVYVGKDMHLKALPLQESAGSTGLGVMAKGSKIPLDLSKKVRAFTYWEKVNDVDLSGIAFTDDGLPMEFSWRTMYGLQSKAITFSGDQTSGFNGGSEYFDINVPAFKEEHPEYRYLVFCNNVFSGVNFCDITCRAGYMLRDIEDSGQVFEPKTVQSSFKIDSNDIFQCLFALDLQTDEFVWLNTTLNNRQRVAGEGSFEFLFDYFTRIDVFNLADLFKAMATQVVATPDDADVIVSDDLSDERSDKLVIHSYDFEKITKYLE